MQCTTNGTAAVGACCESWSWEQTLNKASTEREHTNTTGDMVPWQLGRRGLRALAIQSSHRRSESLGAALTANPE